MSNATKMSSTPTLSEYDPGTMPWQHRLIWDVRKGFDYSLGTHEVLVSGTVGSGKSLPIAHLATTHVLKYPGANFGIGRRVLGDLKDTFCQKIQEHLFNEGVEYKYNQTSGDFNFSNRSKISAFSWADQNYKKFGSYELSSAAIEEAQENKEDTAADFILSRVGRLSHVPETVLYFLANPDSPGHWLAKRFKVGNGKPAGTVDRVTPLRHAYYSKTEGNKFLKESYINGLRANMDVKLAMRLLDGAWIEIDTERIYHAYTQKHNFKPDQTYKVNPRYPIRVSYDFNIAKGKPLSACFFQYIRGQFHVFAEVIVDGLATEQNLEEAAFRGLFDTPAKYIVHGDAAGRHGDTRSNKSDYELIRSYLNRYRTKEGHSLDFEIDVPHSNPSVRDRHNMVNAHCLNSNGEIRLFVYKGCETTDEGLRLTALKDRAQYIEDDSKRYQHVTTALGYGMQASIDDDSRSGAGSVRQG